MWTRHPPRNEPPPLGPHTRVEPLTAGGGLRAPLFAAAPEAVLDHPVEVGEDHEGERDVEAAAVFLNQEVPLELPDLVVVLLDGAHGIAGGKGERVKAQPSAGLAISPPNTRHQHQALADTGEKNSCWYRSLNNSALFRPCWVNIRSGFCLVVVANHKRLSNEL